MARLGDNGVLKATRRFDWTETLVAGRESAADASASIDLELASDMGAPIMMGPDTLPEFVGLRNACKESGI